MCPQRCPLSRRVQGKSADGARRPAERTSRSRFDRASCERAAGATLEDSTRRSVGNERRRSWGWRSRSCGQRQRSFAVAQPERPVLPSPRPAAGRPPTTPSSGGRARTACRGSEARCGAPQRSVVQLGRARTGVGARSRESAASVRLPEPPGPSHRVHLDDQVKQDGGYQGLTCGNPARRLEW